MIFMYVLANLTKSFYHLRKKPKFNKLKKKKVTSYISLMRTYIKSCFIFNKNFIISMGIHIMVFTSILVLN